MTNTIPAALMQNRHWASVIYLFSNQSKLNMVFNTKYFDLEDGVINISALKRNAAPWSNSEKVMLRLALHLYNEQHKFNLSDLDYLDDCNKKLAFDAIKIRFRA